MTPSQPELFRRGSAWVRADFHLHTKADAEFSYDGDEAYYYSAYVDALRSAGIRVGVISNHNKFDIDEFKALRKTAKKQEIYLLPGVELSIGDGTAGIHVILVFSEGWLEEGDLVNPFLTAMFPGKTVEQRENRNERSEKTLLQLIEELEKVAKEYFLVFAHVEDPKGLWNELQGRLADWRHARYELLRARTLGFQKVRGRDNKKNVVDWLGEWYPAEVEGSDCKSVAEIGKGRQVFMKIGAFTFEAVKYALRDFPARLAPEPLAHKRSYIKSVRFEGGTLNGQELQLSPELNTLIGIRGSGKSSVIEAIRYGLDIPFGEKAQEFEYKQGLLRHSLGSGGAVTICAVDRFGQEYEIRRIWDHSPEVFLDGIQQPGVSIRETIVSKPLYFGQKDLSSSGEGFERDLVEKLLGPEIEAVRMRIEDQKEKVRQAVARYKKLEGLAERKDEYARKKLNAEFQLERYRNYGLEEKLQKQIDFDGDERRLADMLQAVQRLQEALGAVLAEHEDSVRNGALQRSKRNQAFFDDYLAVYGKAVAILDTLASCRDGLGRVIPELARKRQEFALLLRSLKEEFAATERTIGEELKQAGIPAIRTDEFRQLSKSIEQATAIMAELDKEQAKAESVTNELLKELSTLNGLWHEEFELIKAEMDRVNAQHSSLSIDVGYKEDRETFKGFLKDTMRGSKLRESVYDRAIERFVDPIEIFKDKPGLDAALGGNAPVFWAYFHDNLELLLSWRTPDRFIVKYRNKELKEHSLGQRASALMLFILSQREHDVILIDQPEDDLDNQTIYQDVIKLVRSIKSDTQFIFATHNPNFPVLGDAEMVVSCSYLDQRVSMACGGIDDQAVQERIVSVMEGGEEAFNRRKEIYGIWKPRNSSR